MWYRNFSAKHSCSWGTERICLEARVASLRPQVRQGFLPADAQINSPVICGPPSYSSPMRTHHRPWCYRYGAMCNTFAANGQYYTLGED
jgi:hypothetical protein